VAEGTYYARRSARDPAWRERQLLEAREREARRREADPKDLRRRRREATARCRARQAAAGLTFARLLERAAIWHDQAGPKVLAAVLRDEVRRGRIVYHPTTRCFQLNGHIPLDVVEALRGLAAPEVDEAGARAARSP
jgi:hypothetical protein